MAHSLAEEEERKQTAAPLPERPEEELRQRFSRSALLPLVNKEPVLAQTCLYKHVGSVRVDARQASPARHCLSSCRLRRWLSNRGHQLTGACYCAV